MQLALRQIQRAVRWALLWSACTNKFAEFPLSLSKKMNSMGPDDFTFQKRTKMYKCGTQSKGRVKGGKDLIPSVDWREVLKGVI